MKTITTLLVIALGLFAAACSKETEEKFDKAGEQIKGAAEATGEALKSAGEDTVKTLKENEAEPRKTETHNPNHK